MSVFQLGNFTFASAQTSQDKIECDNLDAGDWEWFAYRGSLIVPPFGSVIGVPRGGLPFAKALEKYVTHGPRLVVDDVFTTGKSLAPYLNEYTFALVAFARTEPPPWLYTVLRLS